MADSSRPSSDAREYDVVLLGATGFTGGLTADYLAAHAPDDLRWALAGRSREKLERARTRVAGIDERWRDLPLLVVDSSDADGLADMAGRTKVVATTVGPYLQHGGPLVAACAQAGTDYVDLTGEPEFVDRMYVDHHATAEQSGARIVHACGFDSVPHDLGAFYTVRQLTDAMPGGDDDAQLDAPVRMRGVVRAGAGFSGGTFHSALGAFSRARQMKAAMQARRRQEPRPEGRRSRAVAGKPGRDRELGYWLLPLPTIDPFVVARSGAALSSYGPDFRYSHFAGTRTLRYAAGGAVGAAAIATAAQVGPLRRQLAKRVPQGSGPSAARREKSWFTVDFVAECDGTTVHTRVTGGDPGYTETATMLAESALCLALDDTPETAGQVTTAQAMGEALLARLQAAGIGFTRVS